MFRWFNGIVGEWFDEDNRYLKSDTQFYRQIQEAEEYNKTLPDEIKYPIYQSYLQAIYTSRLLPTKEISSRMSTIDWNNLTKYHSKELDFDIETSTSTEELNKRIRSLSLETANQRENNKSTKLTRVAEEQEFYSEPMEIDTPLNWTNIHSDFTPELQKEWAEWGFTPQTAWEWMNTGFVEPTDVGFIQWLKNWEHKTVENFINYEDKESLWKKYENYLVQYQIQKGKKSVCHPSDYAMRVRNHNNDWTFIHADLNNEALIRNWKANNFTHQQVKEWIDIGLKPTDYNFCAWLRDTKHLTPEQVLNHYNLEQLNQEFFTWWQEQQLENKIEIPPKS